MKFSLEAQKLKDEIFSLYYQRDLSSRQWIGVFERLPIGVLLVNNERVVHHNDKMNEMIGLRLKENQVTSLFLKY